MAESTTQSTHVVMLPWCAFGHLIPFFQLSISLAKSGVHVSFISTPRNIQKLSKPYLSTLPPLLDLVELPLPSPSDTLPEGAEATVDIPPEKIGILDNAHEQLQYEVKQLVSKWLPNWIICDFLLHWATDIAKEFKVKLMFFSVFSAAAVSFYGSLDYLVGYIIKRKERPLVLEDLTSVPDCVEFPSSLAFRKHDAKAIYSTLPHEEKPLTINTGGMRFSKVVEESSAIAIRSCYEIEGEYLNVYQKLTGKMVIPIGLLPPEMSETERDFSDESAGEVFEFLEKQETKSVIFVGFGSQCGLSKEQVFEIAHGLEISELPFIWALRMPNWGVRDDDHVHDFLPTGFVERTSKRGFVCMENWVPQVKILAHPSIGGCLIHSGWGSVIEVLKFGHTLVVLPFTMDQPLNARLLVDKSLAIEVKRNDEDGSFSRDDIAKCLRQAMVLEEGEELRTKTREAAKVVADLKLHHDYMAAFVNFLNTGVWK